MVQDWNGLTDALQKSAQGVEFPPLAHANAFPNENQLRLEVVWRAILAQELAESVATGPIGERMLAIEHAAESRWVSLLRNELYSARGVDQAHGDYAAMRKEPLLAPSDDPCPASTLDAIVGFLKNADAPRVERVVTFNADDWLEYELCRRLGAASFHDRFHIVVQPTFGPGAAVDESAPSDGNGLRFNRIPIIHIHGFLCHPGEKTHPSYSGRTPKHARQPSFDAPNMLVFRDLDYWRTVSNPTSFANHTLLDAMTTSMCVFVGLSFRDMNLLRWVGALAAEHEDTWRRRWDIHFTKGDESVNQGASWARRRKGHRWLTQKVPEHVCRYFEYRGIVIEEVDWRAKSGPLSVAAALQRIPGTAGDTGNRDDP